MFLVDDILLAPVEGLAWIAQEVQQRASGEFEAQSRGTVAELQELYMRLETGQITEAQFDAREEVLLARLEALEGMDEVSRDEDKDIIPATAEEGD